MRPWPDLKYGTGNCMHLFKVSLTNAGATGFVQQQLAVDGKLYGGGGV
jgi:hypothetical protein